MRANSTGIWMKDPTHSLRLVLREGQTVIGGKIIKTITTFMVGRRLPRPGPRLVHPAPPGHAEDDGPRRFHR